MRDLPGGRAVVIDRHLDEAHRRAQLGEQLRLALRAPRMQRRRQRGEQQRNGGEPKCEMSAAKKGQASHGTADSIASQRQKSRIAIWRGFSGVFDLEGAPVLVFCQDAALIGVSRRRNPREPASQKSADSLGWVVSEDVPRYPSIFASGFPAFPHNESPTRGLDE